MDELLITNGLTVTMDKERRVIVDGAVALADGLIQDVGKASDLLKKYPSHEKLDAKRKLIMPGLVNTHSHLFCIFIRGQKADGIPMMANPTPEYSWNIPKLKLYDKEVCKVSAKLSAIEMIRSGVTTTQDSHYINFHLDSFDGVAEAMVESGMRAIIARGSWDSPKLAPAELTESPKEAVAETDKMYRKWHGKGNGRIKVNAEASMIAQSTDEMLQATKEYAREKGRGWGTHIQNKLATSSMSPRTGDKSYDRYGGRTIEFLDSLDVLDEGSMLVHCPYLVNQELSIMAKTGATLAHCPVGLAYGGKPNFVPVPDMIRMGITVGLGSDSVGANDNFDAFQLMKFGALMHKINMGSSPAMTAEKVLEMCTIDAAKALLADKEVGSLEVGKKADVIVLNMDAPGMLPAYNPIKNLVYGYGSASAVETVIIDGKYIMKDRKLNVFDEQAVYDEVREYSPRFMDYIWEYEPNGKYLNNTPWKFI